MMAVSCLSPLSDDNLEGTDNSRDLNSKIYVKSSVTSPWTTTRSSDEAVPLPIYYYLFDTNGTCIDLKVVEESGVKAEFSTSRGDYTIYAICGDSPDVPTKEQANLSDFYQIAANTDICMGKGTVTINEYGSINEVQIPVSHIFSKIRLTLSGVPDAVTAIRATFSSLYESVLLNADYEGTQSVVKDLVNDSEDPSQWILAETYIYPSSSDVLSVSLSVTSADGSVQEISTTTSHILHRGERVSLTSEFRALSRIEVGAVVENGWEDSSDELDFWGNTEPAEGGSTVSKIESVENSDPAANSGTTEEPSQPTNQQPTYAVRAYQQGEMFGDSNAMVYSCKSNDNGGYDLVLVGLKPIKFNVGDNTETLLSEYSSQVDLNVDPSEINWRIPTMTEGNSFEGLRTSLDVVGQFYDQNNLTGEVACVFVSSDLSYRYRLVGDYVSDKNRSSAAKAVYIIPFVNFTI